MSKKKDKDRIKKKQLKEKTGEAFEKLVTAIEMALRTSTGETVKHNIKVREHSGLKTQIDVFIEGRKQIVIECKDKKNDKVKLIEMRGLADVCRNTDSIGIFVSRKGFQRGAQQKAISEGIKMFTHSLEPL